MKVGILVPLYDTTASAIQNFAEQAEANGLAGVFVFDGAPWNGKTAFDPMNALELITHSSSECKIGTLVMRAGDDRSDEVIEQFGAIGERAGDRLIAGLGVGDAASFEAEGRSVRKFEDRISTLELSVTAIQQLGIEVWLGGRSGAIGAVAQERNLPQNLWEPEAGELAAMSTLRVASWAGRCTKSLDAVNEVLDRNSEEGADWSVFLLNGSANDPDGAIEVLSAAIARHQASKN